MVKLQIGEIHKIKRLEYLIEIGASNSEILSDMHLSYCELARLKKKLDEIRKIYEGQK